MGTVSRYGTGAITTALLPGCGGGGGGGGGGGWGRAAPPWGGGGGGGGGGVWGGAPGGGGGGGVCSPPPPPPPPFGFPRRFHPATPSDASSSIRPRKRSPRRTRAPRATFAAGKPASVSAPP